MSNNINARRSFTPKVAVNCDDEPGGKVVVENPWKSAIKVENVKQVSAFVGDLETHLIRMIETYGNNSILVGCVAWLSNPRIIEAMKTHCREVLLLVNDENYATWGNGKNAELYQRLPHITHSLRELFGHLNTPLGQFDTKNYDPVRCIRNTGDALMHSKYIIFFKPMAFETEYGFIYRDIPAAVWTGSMNYTIKASRNQENAVFIESELIARFFFHDFACSFLTSAPIRTTGPSSTNNVNNDVPSSSSSSSYSSGGGYTPMPRFSKPKSQGVTEFTKKKKRPPLTVKQHNHFAAKTKKILLNPAPPGGTKRRYQKNQ